MRLNNSAAIIGFAIASCICLAGCAKKMPECGDQNVQEMINTMSTKLLEKQAAIVGGKYSRKESLRNFFYLASPKISYKQNLSGFASQRQDKEIGKNYCSTTNRSESTIELNFKINPHYAGDEKELLADVSSALGNQGENVKVENDDTIVITTKWPAPDSLEYTAQFSDKGDELIVRFSKD